MTDKDLARVRACILDTLTFLVEQLQSALSPDDDPKAAIQTAKGAIPFLRSRLEKDQESNAMVVFAHPFTGYIAQEGWQERWDNLANRPSGQFSQEIRDLVDRLSDCINAIGQLPPADEAEQRRRPLV